MNKFFNLGSHRSQASSPKPKLAVCSLSLAANKLATCSLQLAAILILTAASCTKEEPKHRDKVTANINGNPWKARCEATPPFGCEIGDVQYYSSLGRLELIAGDGIEGGNLQIILNDVFYPGTYKINPRTQCIIIDKSDPCGVQRHYIDENDPQGIDILTIDDENKIIEGKFHFIGRDTNCLSEPLHITNGYFKMKYRP